MAHLGNAKRQPPPEGAFIVRDARSGAFLTIAEPRVTIPSMSDVGKALSVDATAIKRFLTVMGAVTKRSRDVGNPLQVTIQIDPDGKPRIVAASAGDIPVPPPVVSRTLDDALADARARGRARVAEILAGPEMLSAEAFADHLDTTRATINTWRAQLRVLGLEGPKRGFKYPEWQIDRNGRPFAELPSLFETLGGSPWAVYRFLVQEHGELDGRTGIAALSGGDGASVIAAAHSVSEAFA